MKYYTSSLLLMVTTQVILEFLRLRVRAKIAMEVVVVVLAKVKVMDTVDIIHVTGS
jgi:hypothetical protein